MEVNWTPALLLLLWFFQKCIFYREINALLFCDFCDFFPKNFTETAQIIQKIWRFSSSTLTISLLQKTVDIIYKQLIINRLIIINEICQILQILWNRRRHSPKYSKLQEVKWLTAFNKNFKFPPYLDPFFK